MYDIIIIGGGISGLYTHMELSKTNKYKIMLLERNKYFGGRILQIYDNNVSFPAGAARFNLNHKRVIKLLKMFNMIDFRKDRGFDSDITFIDSKNQFNNTFKNKNGFFYINKVLKLSYKYSDEFLQSLTFKEYAKLILSDNELEFMLVASGYSGQLTDMNAYDAIRLFSNDIRVDIKYWAGKFNILINNIVNYLKERNEKIKLNCFVKSIDYNEINNTYKVHYNNDYVCTKKIILALPKESLLSMNILKPVHCILKNSISCKSLCRTYAVFNKDDEILKIIKNKIVTNNNLRYIIPMDVNKGLIMISYTDYKYTNFWLTYKNNQAILKQKIVSLIKKTFNIKINEPKKVYVHYWSCGVAYWNKNINSRRTSNYLINPLPNIYICGENYSLNQSWVEGAIETSDKCIRLLK